MTVNCCGFDNPIKPLSGGTGASSFNTYAPIQAGGTDSDSFVSNEVSTSTYVLFSAGEGLPPTFQPGAGGAKLLQEVGLGGATSAVFTAFSDEYTNYILDYKDINTTGGTDNTVIQITVSDDGGSSYYSTGYTSSLFRFDTSGTGISTATTRMILAEPYEITNTSPKGSQAYIFINNVNTASTTNCYGFVSYYKKSTAAYVGGRVWCSMPSSIEIDAIKLEAKTSGGTASTLNGNCKLYGLYAPV